MTLAALVKIQCEVEVQDSLTLQVMPSGKLCVTTHNCCQGYNTVHLTKDTAAQLADALIGWLEAQEQ